jgi:hypothetical protein
VVPTYRPDELRAASTEIPSSVRADLAAPGLSANARAIARQVTAGATTPYDKAMALQAYFRDTSRFTYDTTVNFANDDNAIDTFLRVRRGYCQQFAGTFAALARSVGLPTRVAVGFTQGENDPTDPTRYEVKGGQAHAWPEVYLGQYGWVPFEPTPGRGAPGEASYLGIPPAQNDNPGGNVSPTTPKTNTTPSTAPPTVSTAAPDNKLKTEPTPTTSSHHSGIDVASWMSAIALVLLLAALLYAVAVPALYAWSRRRRRALAHDPATRVKVAWLESEEALALVGTARRPDETAREFAERASTRLPTQSAELHELATSADAAVFGVDVVDDEAARRAEASTGSVRLLVAQQRPWWRRALTHLDARTVRVEQPH